MFLILATVLGVGCETKTSQVSLPVSRPRIYVGDVCKHPGFYAWTNGVTVVEAIRMAGGFTDFTPRQIYVCHADGARQKYRLTVDRQFTNDVPLNPGDGLVSLHPIW